MIEMVKKGIDMGGFTEYYEELPRYRKQYRVNSRPRKFKKSAVFKTWVVIGVIIGTVMGFCAYSYLMSLDRQLRQELQVQQP